MRPFPGQEIAEAVKNASHIAVVEKDISFGNEGTVFTNVNSALHRYGIDVRSSNYIGGLGGKNISSADIESIFEGIKKNEAKISFIGIGDEDN